MTTDRSRCGSTCWWANAFSTCSTMPPTVRATGGSRSSTRISCATSPIAARLIGSRIGVAPAARRDGEALDAPAGRVSTDPPPRPDVIAMLDAEGLLPAITFVFSRAGCDAAVAQCLRSSLRLTTEEDRAQIAEVIEHRCGDLAGFRLGRARLLRVAGGPRCAVSPPTTPDCCRCSATQSRSCSPPG